MRAERIVEIQAFLNHLGRAAEERDRERLNALYRALAGEHPCGVRHPAFTKPKPVQFLAFDGRPLLVDGEPIPYETTARDVHCHRTLGHDGPHQAYEFYITSLTEWTADE